MKHEDVKVGYNVDGLVWFISNIGMDDMWFAGLEKFQKYKVIYIWSVNKPFLKYAVRKSNIQHNEHLIKFAPDLVVDAINDFYNMTNKYAGLTCEEYVKKVTKGNI